MSHTADVQYALLLILEYIPVLFFLKFLGSTTSLKHSFEEASSALFSYMTELYRIEERAEIEIKVEGHDFESLLYNFLEEMLFVFSTEFFAVKRTQITLFENYRIEATCYGEAWDAKRHSCGTEIKAITFCNMKINHEEPYHIYIVVDI